MSFGSAALSCLLWALRASELSFCCDEVLTAVFWTTPSEAAVGTGGLLGGLVGSGDLESFLSFLDFSIGLSYPCLIFLETSASLNLAILSIVSFSFSFRRSSSAWSVRLLVCFSTCFISPRCLKYSCSSSSRSLFFSSSDWMGSADWWMFGREADPGPASPFLFPFITGEAFPCIGWS